MSLVAELLLINQRSNLKSLTGEFIESTRVHWRNSNYRSSLYFLLARVPAALGILPAGPEV
jgi:hypothetical protein